MNTFNDLENMLSQYRKKERYYPDEIRMNISDFEELKVVLNVKFDFASAQINRYKGIPIIPVYDNSVPKGKIIFIRKSDEEILILDPTLSGGRSYEMYR